MRFSLRTWLSPSEKVRFILAQSDGKDEACKRAVVAGAAVSREVARRINSRAWAWRWAIRRGRPLA